MMNKLLLNLHLDRIMNYKQLFPMGVIASVVALSAPAAASNSANHAINIAAGSHGVALEYYLGLSPKLNARFVLSDMPVDYTIKDDDANINIKYDRTNVGMLLDFRPMGGVFHLTTGLYIGNHNIGINANVKNNALESFDVGDQEYYGQNLGIKTGARFNKAQPYFGLGWGNSTVKKGFTANFDIGVLYIGKGSIHAKATGEACIDGTDCSVGGTGWFNVADDALFQMDLEKERSDLQKDAKKLQWAPVLQLGFGWRF